MAFSILIDLPWEALRGHCKLFFFLNEELNKCQKVATSELLWQRIFNGIYVTAIVYIQSYISAYLL